MWVAASVAVNRFFDAHWSNRIAARPPPTPGMGQGNAVVGGLKEAFHPFLSSEGIVNVVLHACLYALLAVTLFFTYGSLVDGAVTERLASDIAGTFAHDLAAITSSRDAGALAAGLGRLEAPPDPHADEAACRTNRRLKTGALAVAGACAAASVALLLGLWGLSYWRDDLPGWVAAHVAIGTAPMSEILVLNFVILVFVAATNYAFQTLVRANYRLGDPNAARRHLALALRRWAAGAPGGEGRRAPRPASVRRTNV